MIINADMLRAAIHCLNESNKIFTALDNVEQNVAAKLHYRERIKTNQAIIEAAERSLAE